jgi:hypothetical protein
VGLIFFFNSSWRNSNMRLESRVKPVSENASSKVSESNLQSSDVIVQRTQSQNADLLSEQSSTNGVEQAGNNVSFYAEPSPTDSNARLSVDIPGATLAKSGLEVQPGFLPHEGISKSEKEGIGTSAIQKGGSLDHSGKSVSSSENDQVATNNKVHEGGTVLETGRATSLVQGIAIREVRAGESLSQIAMETYGAQSEKYIEWVKKHNPQIVNPDIILPGQNIVLPMYGNKKESQ